MPYPPEKGKQSVILLPAEKRLAVLAGLVEGNSERAIERMTGVNRETIGRFGLKFGEGARRLHDRLVRGLSCNVIDVDELWAYCGVKGSRVTEKHGPDAGEQWVWAGIDRLTKLIVSFHVGRRDQESANAFIADLRSRLVTMPSLMCSDGLREYIAAVVSEFGYGATYAQTIKSYRGSGNYDHRYAPGRGTSFVNKKAVLGAPDMGLATTYAIERNHLTMRHHIGRMRRLCLAFSKKLPNHRAAVSLNYVHYNLCLISKPLRMTPAMAAGVTDRLWSLEELCETLLTEPEAAKPEKAPLAHRAPEGTARELPNGRGFLRVVAGRQETAPAPPPPASVATSEASAAPSAGPADDRQLDLFSWKPKPRGPVQFTLFGDPEEPN